MAREKITVGEQMEMGRNTKWAEGHPCHTVTLASPRKGKCAESCMLGVLPVLFLWAKQNPAAAAATAILGRAHVKV